MKVCRGDIANSSIIALYFQIIIINDINKFHLYLIFQIERIQIDSAFSRKWMIIIINNHENIINNLGRIHSLCSCLIRSKSKGLIRDKSGYIDVNLFTSFTKTDDIQMAIMRDDLAADLSSVLSWNVLDVLD